MLTNSNIIPTIAVTDLQRARRFYADVLGLTESDSGEGWAYFGSSDGRCIELYEKPEAKPADSTRVQFEVADLDKEVAELQSHGASFEPVDLPGAQRSGFITSIGPDGRVAWLKDPDGNWLALHDPRPAQTVAAGYEEQPAAP